MHNRRNGFRFLALRKFFPSFDSKGEIGTIFMQTNLE